MESKSYDGRLRYFGFWTLEEKKDLSYSRSLKDSRVRIDDLFMLDENERY